MSIRANGRGREREMACLLCVTLLGREEAVPAQMRVVVCPSLAGANELRNDAIGVQHGRLRFDFEEDILAHVHAEQVIHVASVDVVVRRDAEGHAPDCEPGSIGIRPHPRRGRRHVRLGVLWGDRAGVGAPCVCVKRKLFVVAPHLGRAMPSGHGELVSRRLLKPCPA